MKRFSAILALAAAGAAAFAAAQDVIPVVCPDCDVEALEAPWICPKCGRQLDAPSGEPGPAPAEAVPDGPVPALSGIPAVLRENARYAAAHAEADPAEALAAVRNAIALAALAPDSLPAAGRKSLVARETALLARLASETALCPHCHGTGRVDAPKPPKPPAAGRGRNFKSIESVAVADLNRAATRACPLCGGAGRIRRATDRKRLAGLVGHGKREFSIACRGTDRMENVSGVWLPPGAFGALSEDARAALAAAVPDARACPDCVGTGTQPCRACGGFGRVLCTNRDFHSPPKSAGEGADRKAIESTLVAPTTRDPCPACGGAWDAPRAVSCPDCDGRGVAPCPSCSGTGDKDRGGAP